MDSSKINYNCYLVGIIESRAQYCQVGMSPGQPFLEDFRSILFLEFLRLPNCHCTKTKEEKCDTIVVEIRINGMHCVCMVKNFHTNKHTQSSSVFISWYVNYFGLIRFFLVPGWFQSVHNIIHQHSALIQFLM